ncbi:hypothetical protein ACI6PS_15005 [Flavobacterium sp. PLA-1-15]|uniref:hypothetical protein n=1 Tax=Flavobacterium sp. PLA-1-15 TaxID=3380533 RepID=UPI003B7B76EA
MAKNIGLIKFTGKLGNLSGRETEYGNIISTPGGFKGERIKTEERYAVTRQLGSEFGRCAKISSQLYNALHFYLQTIPFPHLYGSVQAQITNIKNCDAISPKGERSFKAGLETVQGMKMLQGFSFNPKRNLRSGMMQHYAVDLPKGQMTLPNFDASRVYFPKGAEKLGLQLVLLRLDTELPLCTMETSPLTLVGRNDASNTITLEAVVPEGEGILIALLYFSFCTVTDGEVYFLKDAYNVLEVVEVSLEKSV